jgi:hypothetical protein
MSTMATAACKNCQNIMGGDDDSITSLAQRHADFHHHALALKTWNGAELIAKKIVAPTRLVSVMAPSPVNRPVNA